MVSAHSRASFRSAAVQLYNGGCAALGRGAHELAASYFRGALRFAPGWDLPRFNLASALQAEGNVGGAIEALRVGVADHPDNHDMAFNLGTLLLSQHRYAEALPLLATLAAHHPGDQRYIDNLAQAKWRVSVADAAEAAGSEQRRILLAAMPKSGSTWLADILASLPGMRRVHLVPDYGRRNQMPMLALLAHHKGGNYVCQLHVKPDDVTHELITAFALRPLVLVRNIWDVMTSMRDHMYGYSLDWSMAQVDPEFLSWDEDRQYDFLARAMMPWFVDFYVSWWRTREKLPVRYEELVADPAATIAKIVDWIGLNAKTEDIATAIADAGRSATFNQGGSGRGRAVPQAARAHVLALAAYYPDVDFAPLLG